MSNDGWIVGLYRWAYTLDHHQDEKTGVWTSHRVVLHPELVEAYEAVVKMTEGLKLAGEYFERYANDARKQLDGMVTIAERLEIERVVERNTAMATMMRTLMPRITVEEKSDGQSDDGAADRERRQ